MLIIVIVFLVISVGFNIVQWINIDIEKEKSFIVTIEDIKKNSKKLKLESKYITIYPRDDGYYQLTLSQDNHMKISQYEIETLKIEIFK